MNVYILKKYLTTINMSIRDISCEKTFIMRRRVNLNYKLKS